MLARKEFSLSWLCSPDYRHLQTLLDYKAGGQGAEIRLPVLKQLLEVIMQLSVPDQVMLKTFKYFQIASPCKGAIELQRSAFLSCQDPAQLQIQNNSDPACVRRTPACVHPALAQKWRSWHQQTGQLSAPEPESEYGEYNSLGHV